MDNVRVLRYNWYTGYPEYGSFGGYLARQYDHLSTMVVLTHAPKLGNYYVIVTMKETEDGEPRTLEPVLLSGSFWLIPNIYTQIAQEISFQFCCKTETGDFEQHSEHIRGLILQSKDHGGTAVDVDPSIMFDPYKKWVESIAMAAGAIIVDSELSNSSTNPVQNRVVKAAIDGLADDVDAINGRLGDLKGTVDKVEQILPYYPTFVRGSANYQTGLFVPGGNVLNRIIETEYIPTNKFDTLHIKYGLYYFVCYYDDSKNFVSASTVWLTEPEFTLDTTKAFARVALKYSDNSDFETVPDDAAYFVNTEKEYLPKVDFTKNNLGLGNVDNTSDANKPISIATQEALDRKFGFSKNADATLIDLENIGVYGDSQLSNTRRWFIDHVFKRGDYLNEVKFKVNKTVSPRIIYFEVWEKSGNSLTKKKTVSINTQEAAVTYETAVYTLSLDYNCESECVLSFLSGYFNILYKNYGSTENTILASTDVSMDTTSLLYSSLAIQHLDPSITVYFIKHTKTNIVTIGPAMDYEEIQDALLDITDDSVTNPYTLLVMPRGTPYAPFSMLRSSWSASYPWSNISPRYISIIGVDKRHCVIQSDSGNYKLPCGEPMTNGIIKNLKFVMTNDSQDPAATQGGYCLHIDCRTKDDVGYNMVIEDCEFEDASGPCLGIGMHKNCTLTIRRCNFHTTLAANYSPHEGYTNLVNYGVIFCHSSTLADSTNQKISIEDCSGLCEEGNKGLWLATAGDYDPSTASFYYKLLRNVFWNKTQNAPSYNISSMLTADNMNFGNNIP